MSFGPLKLTKAFFASEAFFALTADEDDVARVSAPGRDWQAVFNANQEYRHRALEQSLETGGVTPKTSQRSVGVQLEDGRSLHEQRTTGGGGGGRALRPPGRRPTFEDLGGHPAYRCADRSTYLVHTQDGAWAVRQKLDSGTIDDDLRLRRALRHGTALLSSLRARHRISLAHPQPARARGDESAPL